ncbi:MAG: MerC domain-containing protein [Candidatus Poribacteria bacterium]|nr:MerC domain-containing protein [Candidatus Poribacteria bacterium]
MRKYFNQEFVDTTGACLSFACAVHCLAMPLLVAVLPLIGLGFLVGERAELVIIICAVALATGSLAWGVRHHRSWRVFLILVVALAFIATAQTTVEGTFEVIFHSVGGVLLASAHLANRHLCKTCPACEPGDV